jgi:hypothetical protein
MVRNAGLALIAVAASIHAASFTIEQVLSAPFPSEMVASPVGAKVAWLFNERGARNVWMAAAPGYKGVRLTSYTGDNGQDIGQLRWTPDGRSVVYTRGGDLEFLGRPDPNPASDPAGVEQAIWIVTPGEQPRNLAEGHSPRFRSRAASPICAPARSGPRRSTVRISPHSWSESAPARLLMKSNGRLMDPGWRSSATAGITASSQSTTSA